MSNFDFTVSDKNYICTFENGENIRIPRDSFHFIGDEKHHLSKDLYMFIIKYIRTLSKYPETLEWQALTIKKLIIHLKDNETTEDEVKNILTDNLNAIINGYRRPTEKLELALCKQYDTLYNLKGNQDE